MARHCRAVPQVSAVVPCLEQRLEQARGPSTKVLHSSPPVAATRTSMKKHIVVEHSPLVELAATRRLLDQLQTHSLGLSLPAPPMRDVTRPVHPMHQPARAYRAQPGPGSRRSFFSIRIP